MITVSTLECKEELVCVSKSRISPVVEAVRRPNRIFIMLCANDHYNLHPRSEEDKPLRQAINMVKLECNAINMNKNDEEVFY